MFCENREGISDLACSTIVSVDVQCIIINFNLSDIDKRYRTLQVAEFNPLVPDAHYNERQDENHFLYKFNN